MKKAKKENEIVHNESVIVLQILQTPGLWEVDNRSQGGFTVSRDDYGGGPSPQGCYGYCSLAWTFDAISNKVPLEFLKIKSLKKKNSIYKGWVPSWRYGCNLTLFASYTWTYNEKYWKLLKHYVGY